MMSGDAIQAGAMHRGMMFSAGSSWQDIATAPRDGTVIEIRCDYGTAPWYDLARWVAPSDTHPKVVWRDSCGVEHEGVLSPSTGMQASGWQTWDSANDGGWHGFVGSSHLKWRPYAGRPEDYRDPTGGMQRTPQYWRGAVASKYGLPLDYFDKPKPAKSDFDFGWMLAAVVSAGIVVGLFVLLLGAR